MSRGTWWSDGNGLHLVPRGGNGIDKENGDRYMRKSETSRGDFYFRRSKTAYDLFAEVSVI